MLLCVSAKYNFFYKVFSKITASGLLGSSAENIEDFFAIARNSLRLYLKKKVGPVFRSSDKVRKDLSEADLAELIGSWLEVGSTCFQFFDSLKAIDLRFE
jgi:hypothetical protein